METLLNLSNMEEDGSLEVVVSLFISLRSDFRSIAIFLNVAERITMRHNQMQVYWKPNKHIPFCRKNMGICMGCLFDTMFWIADASSLTIIG
jgi:hypothetical protein